VKNKAFATGIVKGFLFRNTIPEMADVFLEVTNMFKEMFFVFEAMFFPYSPSQVFILRVFILFSSAIG